MYPKKSASGIVAGVCFLASILINLLYNLLNSVINHWLSEYLRSYFTSPSNILYLVLVLVLAVMLIADLRSFAAAIPAALIGLSLVVFNLIRESQIDLFRILFFLQQLGWLSLAVVLLCADPKVGGLKKSMKPLFFLPAILFAVYRLPLMLRNLNNLGDMLRYSPVRGLSLALFSIFLPTVAILTAVFFAGKWAVEEPSPFGRPMPYGGGPNYNPNAGYGPRPGYNPNTGYNPNAGYRPNTGYSPNTGYNPNAGYSPNPGYAPAPPVREPDAETKLRNFRQLLEDGLITQEEFDAKKRELLG